MNFQEWLILNESKEEKALALELAGNQDNYNQLLTVIPQNQKESDPLLLLASYYLTQSKDLNQIKQDIQDYIKLLKNNKMPLIKVNLNTKKPDTPFDSYLHWTQIIHGHQGEEQAKQARNFKPSDLDFQNEKPIATSPDGLIKVYQSNSPNQCIILGKGQSFCISQPGNTMWKSYRDSKGSTFYFVYDDSRKDNLSIVVVDASKHGLELTDKINTTGSIQNPDNPNQKDKNPQIYMDYLKSKGIDTNIFKNLPKTQEEIEEDNKLGYSNKNLNWFISLSPKEKSNYIGRGHKLSNEQFDYLFDNKFYSLLEQYVKTGLQLNDYQIDKIATNKDLTKNYVHNRLIANQIRKNINAKEYNLLNQQQKEKLFEDTKEEHQMPLAISFNDLERIKNLAAKGFAIGENAVEIAAKNGGIDVIKYLVEEKNADIGNAVEIAICENHPDCVQYLLEKGGKIGKFAILCAAKNEDIKMIDEILKKGGKIDDDAVSAAAQTGNTDVVDFLLQKGAKINKAVDVVAGQGKLEMMKYLLEKGGKIYNWLPAAENGHDNVIKYLVSLGLDINQDNGLIRDAIKEGNLKAVKTLVDNGAKIGEYYIWDALASWTKDHDDIARYLIEKDGKIKDACLTKAVQKNDLDMVKLIYEKNVRDDAAVCQAAHDGFKEILEYLVEKGEDLDGSVDCAVRGGNLDIVKYLVEKGAKIEDSTIYDAKQEDKTDIKQYLKSIKYPSLFQKFATKKTAPPPEQTAKPGFLKKTFSSFMDFLRGKPKTN